MRKLAQAMIDPSSVDGGLIAAVPTLGQELIVRTGERFVNVGQVRFAEYEDGSGKGFCIRTTRIKHKWVREGATIRETSVYVKLENPGLAIPLHHG